MPSRLPGRSSRLWLRVRRPWFGKDRYIYLSSKRLVVVIRGFRRWWKRTVVVGHRLTLLADLDELLEGVAERCSMKRLGKGGGERATLVPKDPLFGKNYPSLFAFLADVEYDAADGGGARTPGVLVIWCQHGEYAGKLIDKDSGHAAFIGGSSWGELLTSADATCSDPAGGWRPDPGASKKRK